MKQIRTVIQPLCSATRFDNIINRLLSEGWELKNRKIVDVPGELSESFNSLTVNVLYAELERHNPPFPEEITI